MASSDPPSIPGPRGPVRASERALAPDLARGTMLLFIALANASGFGSGAGAAPPGGLERAVDLLLLVLVHARAYPVFALMFGYGLVQLARRQEAAGASAADVRSVLLRRNAWLVGFGLVHAALLYYGDFLGAYGLIGIAATLLLLPRGDRFLRLVLWAWAASVVHVLVLAARAAAALGQAPSLAANLPVSEVASLAARDYASSLLARLAEWPAHTLTVLPCILIVWLGMWAARRRLLEEAASHRRLLAGVAAAGLGIAFAGGLPFALISTGVLPADAPTGALVFFLHQVSGTFGGPGYVALFGLAALGLSGRTSSPVVRALSALGQRSLSGYLFQSVAWLLLLSPFTLALGHLSAHPTLTEAGLAALVWLTSVVGAYLLDRCSRPGPAEALLRRLTYGKRR
jgi:uncharacterized membrane protein YeiB